MILINLLPHRERARAQAQRDFHSSLLGAAVLGGLVAVLVYLGYQHQIDGQRSRNAYLRAQITALDAQIKEVAGLEKEIADLKARQRAVQSLQLNRNLAVQLLSGVLQDLPEGMFLTQVKQQGNEVLIEGMAQSNERVSELLRNLAESENWIEQPDLREIVGSELTVEGGRKRRAYKFTVRFKLREAAAPQAAQAPAKTRTQPAHGARTAA